jgi:Tfp pilus assembly protein PilN
VIRANLSTRPFYKERGVRIGLVALAILIAAATVFNVARVLTYSQSDTERGSQASRDEAGAADRRGRAARLRATIDPKQIAHASSEARQANDLIDRRTFSWTELFNQFETTLPDDVRITSVRPKIDAKKGFVLTITVVARGVGDVSQLMENLETTGAFKDLLPPEQHVNDQGLLEATIEATYTPRSARADTPGAKPQ